MLVKSNWWRRWTQRLSRGNSEEIVAQSIVDEPPGDRPVALLGESPNSWMAQTMLDDERYALLLRRQVTETLSGERYAIARDALERTMALIPAGVVEVEMREAGSDEPAFGELCEIEALFLDRSPVTNRQFKRFVAGGGYDLQPLWDANVWPAVKGFVDQSGTLGPRFWRNGEYTSGDDDHPVVGVSWHEAAAYARWVGKRLPSEAEWVKAAAWPIALGDGRHRQRRYPWGDTMDHSRCNLWGSGPGRTAAVTQFSSGVSAGGVFQLIGNVWEWTSGDFQAVDSNGNVLELPAPMKSIRGGAFDTYFDQQATCQFRSGDSLLARKHNIGFRCSLSACDVAPRPSSSHGEKGAVGHDWVRAFKDMGLNVAQLAGFHSQEQHHD